MGYDIANSSAENTIFTAGGTAYSASVAQPNLRKSTIAGVTDSALAKADDYGLISNVPQVTYTGYDDTEIILGHTNTIRDAANTSLISPGADLGSRRSIQKLEAVRTKRVASAVRAGYWHETSGGWLTAPTTSNDQSALGQDDEAVVNRATPGNFAFSYHGQITQEAYPAKLQ